MSRIAIVDLVFHWPPGGGSMVDVREVAIQLLALGHDVKLFIAHFEDFYPRGRISESPGVDYEQISFNRFTMNHIILPRAFRKRVERFKPDLVFLADGYSFKPYISDALKEYPQFWRAYAYEIFCPLNHLIDWKQNYSCKNTLIKDQKQCETCVRIQLRHRKTWIKLVFGMPDPLKVLFPFHEFWFGRANTSKFIDLFEAAIERSRAILVYNSLQKMLFEPYNSNIVITPTGVSDLFKPIQNYSRSDTSFDILMSGRIHDFPKGFATIFEAVTQLHRLIPHVRLLLTAQPLFQLPDAPFIHNLGWLSPAELAVETAKADLIVVPSLWQEPFGIVAIEGMACAKPVIGTRVGGLQDIIVEDRTGYLVEPGNSEQLSERILQLIKNPEHADQLGQNALQRVNEQYRWSRIMDNVYRPLLRSF